MDDQHAGTCPKRMTYGPCGGVRPDGTCEMRAIPCAFPAPVPWSGADVAPVPVTDAPLVLTDFSAAPFDVADLAATARTLAGACDAVLVGEHQNRPDYPSGVLAPLLAAAGVRPWLTLACRDRNRIVLEQELRGLRLLGVDTVLCVTGDGRGYDVRPDVTQVFDLDGTRLASLAATLGLSAAVAETPSAPPVDVRGVRLVHKQRAGAAIAVLNHVRRPAQVAGFMRAARDAGLTIPVLAAVAVVTDVSSAAVLQGLPGLELDDGVVTGILSAPDPIEAGIAAAVREARAVLAVEGVVGVNVSGSASGTNSIEAARIKAEVGRRILAERGAA